MEDSPRPRIWDTVSAKEAAEWARMTRSLGESLGACQCQVRLEEELEEELEGTRQEIEALPVILPNQ